MPIPVKREPPEVPFVEETAEACALCGKGTPYWTNIKTRPDGEQVACCRPCARRRDVADVPSKRAWVEKEMRG